MQQVHDVVLVRDVEVFLPSVFLFGGGAFAGVSGFAAFIWLAIFVLFYLLTVFTLGWATTHLGYTREEFLIVQMAGIIAAKTNNSTGIGLILPV